MFARAKPLLLTMGAAAHHAGATGSGMAVKLAVNALLGIRVAAAGELVEMLRRQGLSPARAIEIIGATPVCGPAAKVAAGMMLANAFAPMFPIELAHKDFGYALDAAGSASMAPMIAAAKKAYSQATMRGLGGDHLTSVVQLYRRSEGA
jgi:3-hydroxyisobutyrate dehydrogenase